MNNSQTKAPTTHVLLQPRITEKAAFLSTKNVYAFDVLPQATKSEIIKAIKFLYKVTPIKVSVITRKPRHIMRRGKVGTKSGGKKAYVYLKAGDKIEIM